jgi:hypothetical protein
LPCGWVSAGERWSRFGSVCLRCAGSRAIARPEFILFPVFGQPAPRTIWSWTDWIIRLFRFQRRPPVDPGNVGICLWRLRLINERKRLAVCINLAIPTFRIFYGADPGRGIEPLMSGIGGFSGSHRTSPWLSVGTGLEVSSSWAPMAASVRRHLWCIV